MRVKKFRPKKKVDKLIYASGIVENIVLLAVDEIPYAEIYRGFVAKKSSESAVKVCIEKSNVTVDVSVTIHFSQSVSDMAFKIQEAVKYNVESMTDYTVSAVNVLVKGVTFEDVVETPKSNKDGAGVEIGKTDDAKIDQQKQEEIKG